MYIAALAKTFHHHYLLHSELLLLAIEINIIFMGPKPIQVGLHNFPLLRPSDLNSNSYIYRNIHKHLYLPTFFQNLKYMHCGLNFEPIQRTSFKQENGSKSMCEWNEQTEWSQLYGSAMLVPSPSPPLQKGPETPKYQVSHWVTSSPKYQVIGGNNTKQQQGFLSSSMIFVVTMAKHINVYIKYCVYRIHSLSLSLSLSWRF